MIHLPSLRDFTRDTAQALGILAAVAAVTDWATENRRLRARVYELEWEVTRLSQINLAGAGTGYEPVSADDLMALADAIEETAIYGEGVTPPSSGWQSSAAIHPSLIAPLCEEFGREIDARIDAVTEEWSA